MDDKKFDEQLKKSLREGTESSMQDKQNIWAQIEDRLDQGEQEQEQFEPEHEQGNKRTDVHALGPRQNRRGAQKMKKKRRARRWMTASIAAGLLFGTAFFTVTETGQAVVSQIKQMFEPEKDIVNEIEGIEEENRNQRHENESVEEREADYVIYVDEERYAVSKEDGVHRIEAKIDGDYPDVYMEIRQHPDQSPEDLVAEIEAQLKEEYPTVHETKEVDQPVEGYELRALAGQEWNSEVAVYYVLSNEIEGSFVIEQAYFLEASEGHGARFYHMLEEFYIVTDEEQQ